MRMGFERILIDDKMASLCCLCCSRREDVVTLGIEGAVEAAALVTDENREGGAGGVEGANDDEDD